MFWKSLKLFLNLECKLSSVGKHKSSEGFRFLFHLIQNGEDKDSSFTHTRLGLAEHIHSHSTFRNALLLNYKGQVNFNIWAN